MRVADCQACEHCPLRGDGSQQLVQDAWKPGAHVYLLVNQAGEKNPLDRIARLYLPLAALAPSQVSVGHAIRCTAELPKPVTPQQFALGKRGVLENAVRYCDRVHGGRSDSHGNYRHAFEGLRLVVASGDLALYAATGQRSSHEWRGWVLPYRSLSDTWLSEVWTPSPGELPVLPTVSLRDIGAMPTLTYATRADWSKAGRILRGEWPTPFLGYSEQPPGEWPKVSAFDTEFDPQTGVLERYSLYNGQGVPHVVEAADVETMAIPETVTVVMHNVEADLQYLYRMLHGGIIKTEDTMLMHAVLWSDLPHTLEFLGSIYAPINRWKHLFYRNPKVYSAGDAIGTWAAYTGMVYEFRDDPESARVYRDEIFPLTAIIMEAETVGLRLDQERVKVALTYHQQLQAEVLTEAQAYAGYPLLLSSPEQVARHLYDVEKVGVKGAHGKRA